MKLLTDVRVPLTLAGVGLLVFAGDAMVEGIWLHRPAGFIAVVAISGPGLALAWFMISLWRN